MPEVRYLTTETVEGQRALRYAMEHCYWVDETSAPPEWQLVRLADEQPVAFALVDPKRRMHMRRRDLIYPFLEDIGTVESQRRQGHFTGLMQELGARLRAAGHGCLVTHGRAALYQPLGFTPFTRHVGLFLTPEGITQRLGDREYVGRDTIEFRIDDVRPNLFYVIDANTWSWENPADALRAIAREARQHGRTRILIEEPTAPSYGSHYYGHGALQGELWRLAMECGGQIMIQSPHPESDILPDADMICVLDAWRLVERAAGAVKIPSKTLTGSMAIRTEAGALRFEVGGGEVHVTPLPDGASETTYWPATVLAQVVTGYLQARDAVALYDLPLTREECSLLDYFFHLGWRLSHNESWIYPR